MTPKERAAMQAAWVWMDWYASNNGTLEPVDLNETITALREALDHCGEANEMVGCAYCNNPLFAGTKCNNCGFITLAEQAEQEPVAWHHPQCEGQCIACLIEKAVQDAYGTQGRDYMLRHINAAPVRTKDQK